MSWRKPNFLLLPRLDFHGNCHDRKHCTEFHDRCLGSGAGVGFYNNCSVLETLNTEVRPIGVNGVERCS